MNKRYDFLGVRYDCANFVVGNYNKKAYEAAQEVVIGKNVKPIILFLGDIGMGKKHLLSCLITEWSKYNFRKNCIIFTAEQFVLAVEKAFQADVGNVEEFLKEYLTKDLLVVSDVHNIEKDSKAGRVFELLMKACIRKKITVCMSANTTNGKLQPSDAIKVVKMQKLDIETAEQIVFVKSRINFCEEEWLSEDVLKYIAETAHENVRVLEGSLNKIIANKRLAGTELVDVSYARKILEAQYIKCTFLWHELLNHEDVPCSTYINFTKKEVEVYDENEIIAATLLKLPTVEALCPYNESIASYCEDHDVPAKTGYSAYLRTSGLMADFYAYHQNQAIQMLKKWLAEKNIILSWTLINRQN